MLAPGGDAPAFDQSGLAPEAGWLDQYHVDGKLPTNTQPLPHELEAFFRGLGARFSKRGMDMPDAPQLIAGNATVFRP